MADDNKSATEQKKARQAEDGRKAALDYEAEAAALRAKTERLRALRLARDAALPAAPARSPAKKAARKTKAEAKAQARPLAEWLSDLRKDGLRD
jgi:hypothetical protein